jgi:RNA polymerase sigma factor (sigma-70 family)
MAAPGSVGRIGGAEAPATSGASAIDALLDNRTSLRALLVFCLYELGPGATYQDAEDALHDFCLLNRQKIIGRYKPGAQSIVTYFKLCLRRFCWKRGRTLRLRLGGSVSLEDVLELGDAHHDSSLRHPVADDAEPSEREVLRERLRKVMGTLTAGDERLLKLFYVENLSIREIATKHLHKSESAVKVQLFRVRRRLGVLLEGVK